MITRFIILYLILILFAFGYAEWRFLRHVSWKKHLLLWIPELLFVAYTVFLAFQHNFVPDPPTLLYVWLFLLALIIFPLLLFALFSLTGNAIDYLRARRHPHLLQQHAWRKWLERLSAVPSICCIYVLIYGTFVGFYQFEVRHIDLTFDELPASFNGYRIVQFSDAHVGTLTGNRAQLLQRAVDSINAQHPDMIVFTGDLQNQLSDEIRPHIPVLSKLKAKDGIYSVRGNHDYGYYNDLNIFDKNVDEETTVGLQQDMKWNVLMNSHQNIKRGDDILVIAGMENDGEGRFPQKGNISYTLWGSYRTRFTVMLEHDPTAWRRKILPHSHSQLTLSGHTHAGQFSLFGFSPARFLYHEFEGLYRAGNRVMYVSKGLGGVIPFRFGTPGEIVVITLHRPTTSSQQASKQ